MIFSVNDFGGGCDGNPHEGDESESEGDDKGLDVLFARTSSVTGEITDVYSQSC